MAKEKIYIPQFDDIDEPIKYNENKLSRCTKCNKESVSLHNGVCFECRQKINKHGEINKSEKEITPSGVSVLSILSVFANIALLILCALTFFINSLIPILIIFNIISIAFTFVAKKIRITKNKKGKIFEIVAIVIGGLNFMCLVSPLSNIPFWTLGWIFGFTVHKLVK